MFASWREQQQKAAHVHTDRAYTWNENERSAITLHTHRQIAEWNKKRIFYDSSERKIQIFLAKVVRDRRRARLRTLTWVSEHPTKNTKWNERRRRSTFYSTWTLCIWRKRVRFIYCILRNWICFPYNIACIQKKFITTTFKWVHSNWLYREREREKWENDSILLKIFQWSNHFDEIKRKWLSMYYWVCSRNEPNSVTDIPFIRRILLRALCVIVRVQKNCRMNNNRTVNVV